MSAHNPSTWRMHHSAAGLEPVLVCMSDVEPEAVEWLWEPYIPLGKLTLVEGNPGAGKTWLTIAIGAHLTTGRALPGCSARSPANVITMTCEDGLADTVRPRLDRAGADPRRVYALDGCQNSETGERRPFELADVDVLAQALKQTRAAAVFIDPLQGYLGSDVDMHRANQVRPLLAGLARLAEEHRCAIVIVRHIRKNSSEHATQRGLGSIDFSAAARSILLVGEDPASPGLHIVAHPKSSLAPRGKSCAFTLEGGVWAWAGTSELTAEDLLRPAQQQEADPESDFLRELLADGPVAAKDVAREAREAGFHIRTLRRRKGALGIRIAKERDRWVWYPPD